MLHSFTDINESEIFLQSSAIWGVTIPVEGPAEVLLDGANKSVKISKEVAKELLSELLRA